MYLLDTNVVSELRKPRPHGGVIAWLSTYTYEDLFVPAVVVGELQAGAEITRQQDEIRARELEAWIELITEQFEILPMTAAGFRIWAKLMHRKSSDLSEDAMIAATAFTHDLTVVTRNVRDFIGFDVPTLNPFTHKS